jgi:hypothetical protein
MQAQNSKSLIAQELKVLNFLLQNPKLTPEKLMEVHTELVAITTALKAEV